MAASGQVGLIILGNSKAGKSFLASNLLACDESGRREESSITESTQQDVVELGGRTFRIFDLPGGLVERNQDAIDRHKFKIQKAFEKCPNCVVLFVMRTNGGRVTEEASIAFNTLYNGYSFSAQSLLLVINGTPPPSNRVTNFEGETIMELRNELDMNDATKNICFLQEINPRDESQLRNLRSQLLAPITTLVPFIHSRRTLMHLELSHITMHRTRLNKLKHEFYLQRGQLKDQFAHVQREYEQKRDRQCAQYEQQKEAREALAKKDQNQRQREKLRQQQQQQQKAAATRGDVNPTSARAQSNHSAVIILGNSGVGKSFLANIFLGRKAFEHKSKPSSVTTATELKVVERNGISYSIFDIPGLNESNQGAINRNKIEIRKAFQLCPNSVVVFVIHPRNGRLMREDVDAFNSLHRDYGFETKSLLLVVNQVPQDRDATGTYEREMITELKRELRMPDATERICFLDHIDKQDQRQLQNLQSQLFAAASQKMPKTHEQHVKIDDPESIDDVHQLKSRLSSMKKEFDSQHKQDQAEFTRAQQQDREERKRERADFDRKLQKQKEAAAAQRERYEEKQEEEEAAAARVPAQFEAIARRNRRAEQEEKKATEQVRALNELRMRLERESAAMDQFFLEQKLRDERNAREDTLCAIM